MRVRTATAAPSTSLPVRGEGTTILVTEDESAVRDLVRRLLTRQGYRVIEAANGVEALARWTELRDEIKILLTDIVMPGHPDGHELVAQLHAAQPGLRIITMSGYDPSDIAQGRALTHPHVRKPFTADDLLKAIDTTLKNSRA